MPSAPDDAIADLVALDAADAPATDTAPVSDTTSTTDVVDAPAALDLLLVTDAASASDAMDSTTSMDVIDAAPTIDITDAAPVEVVAPVDVADAPPRTDVVDVVATVDVVCSACAAATARPVAPLTGSWVTSARPTLRWETGGGADGAIVTLCRDRAMVTGCIASDAAGSSSRPAMDLAPGPWFWTVRARVGAGLAATASPPWRLRVMRTTGVVDSSWGPDCDVNGDGVADLPTARDQALYVQLGGSTIRAPWRVEAPFEVALWSEPVCLGDVNGDGYGDIALASPGAAWLARGGASGLATPEALRGPVSSDFGRTVAALGDVDGDRLADVGVAMYTTLYVFRGAAGATALPGTRVTLLGAADPRGVGDVDADGYADIATVETNRSVRLYRGGVGGIDPARATVAPAFTDAAFITPVGDIDCDGRADLAATTYDLDSNATLVVARTAGGAPGAAVRLDRFGWESFRSRPIDLDADGCADLSGNDNRIGAIRWIPGRAAAPSVSNARMLASSLRFDRRTASSPAGDLNGNGGDDLLFSPPSSGQLYLMDPATGAPEASRAWINDAEVIALAPGVSATSEVVAPGDLDRDGLADAVVLDASSLRVVHGRRGAPFVVDAPRALSADETLVDTGRRVSAAGDLDRDGAADLVVAVDATRFEALYGGTGAFPTRAQSVAIPGGACTAGGTAPAQVLGVGDVTGDGYADALIATCRSDEAMLYRGSATGIDPTPTPIVTGTDGMPGFRVLPIALGDLNGDRAPEFALVRMVRVSGGQLRVAAIYPGGSGFQTAVRRIDLGGSAMWSGAALGDLDGDGFGDAILQDRAQLNYARVLRGAASVAAVDLQQQPQIQARLVAGGDVDGDGLADALGAGLAGGVGSYTGLYVFAGARVAPTSLLRLPTPLLRAGADLEFAPRVALSPDIDGNGLADIVYATRGFGAWMSRLPRVRAGLTLLPAVPPR